MRLCLDRHNEYYVRLVAQVELYQQVSPYEAATFFFAHMIGTMKMFVILDASEGVSAARILIETI